MEKSTHSTTYALLRSELQATRKHVGLSQRELAAKLDVPHSWVAKVESGERRIDLIEFARFVAACGVDPAAKATPILRHAASSRSSRSRDKGRSK